MLKRIKISGFRSCQDIDLDDLGPMTVLVGRNAVGKTNILRGIQWLAETATSLESTQRATISGSASLEFVLADVTYFYSLEAIHQTAPSGALPGAPPVLRTLVESLARDAGDGVKQRVLERRDGNVTLWPAEKRVEIRHNVPCMPALMSVLSPDSDAVKLIHPFLATLGAVRYYPLADGDDYATLIPQAAYEDWLDHYATTLDAGRSALMRVLSLALTNQASFEEVCSLLGPDGLGLLDNIGLNILGGGKEDTGEGQRFYQLTFAPGMRRRDRPSLFDFGDLSSGTRRIIRIIVSLLFDHSSVMLLEHPEDDIHAGLLHKLIDILRVYSDRCQLIIASHSAAVFDVLEAKSVRLVTMSDGETKVRALTAEELDAARKYLEEEGTLSEFLEVVGED